MTKIHTKTIFSTENMKSALVIDVNLKKRGRQNVQQQMIISNFMTKKCVCCD
jgi:hypothetical protein